MFTPKINEHMAVTFFVSFLTNCAILRITLVVFNKLNNSEYTNGIVNLSSYSL